MNDDTNDGSRPMNFNDPGELMKEDIRGADLRPGHPLTDREMGDLLDILGDGVGDPMGGMEPPAPPADFADALRRFEGYQALNAMLQMLRDCGAEAENFALQRLKELVAEISQRFWAPTAWLYLKDGDMLTAVVRRMTGRTDPTLGLDQKSIVGHVAKTGRAYYTNDAEHDPHFRPTVKSSSAMAAPLKSQDGEVIGVLCLESRQLDAFSADLRDDLSSAVVELVPHALVMKSLARADELWAPWHPRVHKWDLARLIRRICHAVRESLDAEVADGVECAVWSVDRCNNELFVYGTSGHGMEYIKKETLGFDSFTGSVADAPVGTVGRVRPRIDPRSTLMVRTPAGWADREGYPFQMEYKRTVMGLVEVVASPIHLVDSMGGDGEASYVLAIYAFGEQAAQLIPCRDEILQIAETLSVVIGAYLAQREKMAAAYFVDALAARRASQDFGPLIREFREFLKLEDVHIYPNIGNDELVAINEDGMPRPLDWRDGNRDYLAALLQSPGEPVRVNDVQSRRPRFLDRVPIRDAAGWLPWHDPNHHRFLDVGIKGCGAIRLVRSGQSKPFMPEDEQIFLSLAELCGDAMQMWRLSHGQAHPMATA